MTHARKPTRPKLIEAPALDPLLDLNLRLGEGSGGALALPVIRSALALHAEMATFAEAGVSGPSEGSERGEPRGRA